MDDLPLFQFQLHVAYANTNHNKMGNARNAKPNANKFNQFDGWFLIIEQASHYVRQFTSTQDVASHFIHEIQSNNKAECMHLYVKTEESTYSELPYQERNIED